MAAYPFSYQKNRPMKMDTNSMELAKTKNLKPTSLTMGYRKTLAWLNMMDYYRLMVLVGTILFQGCINAPFALWSMDALVGFDFLQMTIITLSSFAILVANLSDQPMRITIPVFVLLTLAQWTIILINLIG